MLQTFLMTLLILTAVFLIILVLIQRGKGGGLSGALGGMGGQSAFGTKAGDLFTKITMGVAAFWICLCIVTVKLKGGASEGPMNLGTPQGGQQSAPATPGGKSAPANQTPAPASPAPQAPAK
jgi:preprotein translocase subunit SecG